MKQEENRNQKIAVIGIGGVGGYIAAMLTRVYPHVTMVARGERGEVIRRSGLTVHSDYRGELSVMPEKVVSSMEELEAQDYIFICVKNYSLKEVCDGLKPIVEKDTVIIPVMNGVDVSDRVNEYLEKGIVIDSLIYIVAYANADYSVTQEGDFANLRIGIKRNPNSAVLKEVSNILQYSGIDHKVSEDIEREIWKKYILNCAYNVLTACYNNTIGELRRDSNKAKEYERLVYEAYEVAAAKGVKVSKEDADNIIRRFYEELAEDATSSLQRDVWAGKETEFETFSGYLVREAARLGMEIPVTVRMYERLKQILGGLKS